ncbi:MAG: thiamine diphosphokinase [Lachnospiraceae bacterium]|nr:thiamine diphosphokinase [Lachnospiraceae bacterium]
MNKGNCILIGAGDLTVSEIPIGENDLCIAVDAGYEYCKLLEITPDYILGDFDSIGEKEAENVAQIAKIEEDKVIILPVEKDDTDILAAIKLGLEKGYQSYRIYGGMGGRVEHTIANIQCLLYLKEHDAVGYLMDGTGMILVAKDEEISFQDSMEGYMSLFSLGDKAVVSIENMKYPLDECEITNSFPIGISNEFILGEKGKVTVHKGAVVMIVSWV